MKIKIEKLMTFVFSTVLSASTFDGQMILLSSLRGCTPWQRNYLCHILLARH